MLKYFYTGQYNEPITETKDLHPQLQAQVLTHNLAEKYDVQTLMGLAANEFASTLTKGPTPEEYLSVISEVYTIPSSINLLQGIAAEYGRERLRDMIQGARVEVLRATIQNVPEFAVDILQLFATPVKPFVIPTRVSRHLKRAVSSAVNDGFQ